MWVLIGCLENRNNTLGGRKVIAYINMGGSYDEIPQTMKIPDSSHVVAVGGDLRKIDVVREFWKLAIHTLEDSPPALWINFTTVTTADTKLAACIVAILRRATEMGVRVYIIGSKTVSEVLHLCKFPPLEQFTKVA
jgi:anti-anti-sigma regulatory factor